MFKFRTKLKLAKKDKKIIQYLRESDWFIKNRNNSKYDLNIKDIDKKQKWVLEIESFIDFVTSKKRYKELIDNTDLERSDLVDIYLLMTIATMPNPIFKTGNSKMSFTMVGSSIYQEVDKQLKPMFSSLGENYSEHDHKSFGHKYASDVMTFASFLKRAHESSYGAISIDDAL